MNEAGDDRPGDDRPDDDPSLRPEGRSTSDPSGAVARRGSTPRESQAAVAALSQAPLILVLIGVAIGVGLALNGSWRIGAGVIGLSVGIGAVQRLVLPERLVGLLQVRSRAFDVVALATLAVGIAVLAVVVPTST